MTGQTPGSDLYVKECIEFEDISKILEDMKKNPDKQKMTENLQLIKMAFHQLDNNPESFYKKADDKEAVLAMNDILEGTYTQGVWLVIFITFAVIANIAVVYTEKYNTC
jgi:hypothetical protein